MTYHADVSESDLNSSMYYKYLSEPGLLGPIGAHKSKTTEMLFFAKVIHAQTNTARTWNWVLKQEIISSKFYYSLFCHTTKKLTKTQFQWVNDAAAETDVLLNVKTGPLQLEYRANMLKDTELWPQFTQDRHTKDSMEME